MTNLFLHRRDPLSGLEPAFAVAVETIDPALAGRRRLAGPRQALLFRGSGRSGLRGSGVEEVGKRIRRRRRSRESREKDNSGEAKSQMTGHENPGVAPPAARPLAAKWVTIRLKSGKAMNSFWPGNEIGARCCSSAAVDANQYLLRSKTLPYRRPGNHAVKPASPSRFITSSRCARSRVSITTSSKVPLAGRSENVR